MRALKLENLDARVKLFMLLAISTSAVFFRSPKVLAAIFVFTLALMLAGGVSAKDAFMKVRGALGLIASVFILQCLFNRSGEPLLRVWGVTVITRGGVAAAAYVALRLLTVLLSALIVLTGQRRDYLLALTQLKVPYEIAFMVTAALHFLPLLREQAQDVLSAAQMRGARIKKAPVRKRLRLYLALSAPIVAGAVRKSEQTAVAMEARAFRACPRRTSMRRLVMKKSDWAALAAFAVLLAAVVAGGVLWSRAG